MGDEDDLYRWLMGDTFGALSTDRQPPRWMLEASCVLVDPAVFFPDRGESTSRALRICGRCPVRDECLTYALDTEGGQHHGVWGGTTPNERRALARDRAA